MGQSTDAIIAFGFDLGEELPEKLYELMDEHERDIDTVLAATYGIELPQYTGSEYKAYAQAREEATNRMGVDLIEHCSGDYPMYFLCIRGSDKRAGRGSPTALNSDDLNVEFTGIDAIKTFCDAHKIEWQEPKWHIFSMWN